MRLALCYPAYRSQVNTAHLLLVSKLTDVARQGGNDLAVVAIDTAFLDLARDSLLFTAIGDKFNSDFALFMDSDTYTPDLKALIEMVNEGATRNAAVIAAPVQLRRPDPTWNAQIGDRYLPPDEFRGKVIEVDRIGTAFMAVNCHWIRDHWHWSKEDPWFQSRFIDHESGRPTKMSEDYEFCDGVRKRGGLVLCDGRFEPVHAGITSEVQTYATLRGSGVQVTHA